MSRISPDLSSQVYEIAYQEDKDGKRRNIFGGDKDMNLGYVELEVTVGH